MNSTLRIDDFLFLRVLDPSEGQALYAVVDANRQHLREWLPWVDQTRGPADSRQFIERLHVAFEGRQAAHYGIFRGGELVGMVGFHAFDWTNRVTSLGYWLAASACGYGIMRRSVGACLGEAFRVGLNRISIRCAIGNIRSRRIPESLGFTYEGLQRQAEWLNGRYVDLEVHSLLADEWRPHLVASSVRSR